MASKDLVPVEQYAVMQLEAGDLMETLRENLGAAQLTEFDLDRVKMPSGGGRAWDVPTLDGAEPRASIDGVIVHSKDQRAFWQTQFTGGSNPPDCSADDGEHAKGDPGVPVADDENGFHLCATCPNARFGTAIMQDGSQGPGQACKQTRSLFVLTHDALLPVVVSLPPTSLQACKKFFLRLASQGVQYRGVITRIGLEQDKSGGGITYSRATFSVLGRLEGEMAAKMRDYSNALRPVLESQALAPGDAARDAAMVA